MFIAREERNKQPFHLQQGGVGVTFIQVVFHNLLNMQGGYIFQSYISPFVKTHESVPDE